jgi:ATP-dependent Clp protease ATP-binding subunit ClpA
MKVLSLNLGGLIAGTNYRGQFEERLQKMLKLIREHGHCILFIDEIHTLLGLGNCGNASLDAANMLKPALARGELHCIGATTDEEYKRYFAKDRALNRRFQKIELPPSSPEETRAILEALRPHYEQHYQLSIEPAAIESAVGLAGRYLVDRVLPDSAIDLLDEACAELSLRHTSAPVLTADRIVSLVEEQIGQPVEETTSYTERLQGLKPALQATIFGQDQAIDAVTQAVKLSSAGLQNTERPLGSFLFAGPTGSGKTELSRQLAKALGRPLIRFDMSEYTEAYSVSKLIGAAAGYVGFDQGGQLTNAIRKQPHAVLLLDEIEKAHPQIFNLLLQVMDYGTLTDSAGDKTNFRDVVLIMTSNLGAAQLDRPPMGFVADSAKPELDQQAIHNCFPPEFRNRLDASIAFNPLGQDDIKRIVDKSLQQLADKLKVRGVKLSVSPGARRWLAEHGFDTTFGARPLERLIQQEIGTKLADALLFDELVGGGNVSVSLAGGKLSINTADTSKGARHKSA